MTQISATPAKLLAFARFSNVQVEPSESVTGTVSVAAPAPAAAIATSSALAAGVNDEVVAVVPVPVTDAGDVTLSRIPVVAVCGAMKTGS